MRLFRKEKYQSQNIEQNYGEREPTIAELAAKANASVRTVVISSPAKAMDVIARWDIKAPSYPLSHKVPRQAPQPNTPLTIRSRFIVDVLAV